MSFRCLFFLFVCVCTIIFSCKSQQVTYPKEPVRGVWLTNVDSDVLYTPEGIKEAVKLCKESGINHIFVVTWNKGKTLYPSKIMQENFQIPIEEKLNGRDPLRELLNAAHAQNIKVYAWFEFGFSAENNGFGKHILETKPHWAALGNDGKVVVKNGFKWMNALDIEVQDFMLSLLKEVIIQYPDLDGIQGDDRLPALPSECGYNENVIKMYQSEKGQNPPHDTKNEDWVNWRAERLNQFQKRLYTELKKLRPAIQISMSPSIFPWSKEQYLQDWVTWVREGWVDMVCPQVYRYDFTKYQKEIQLLVNEQIPADKRPILVPGVLLKVGKYTPTETFLEQMIEENRKQNIQGEVFFFYEGLKLHPDFFSKKYKNY
jgi:uncharacterized lipoprotein YddW (UPF0748 family)